MDRKQSAKPYDGGGNQDVSAPNNPSLASRLDSKLNKPVIKDDDDALLAAALGATNRIEDMAKYENSVVRNAELSSTPCLMMSFRSTAESPKDTSVTPKDTSVKLGFPSLHGLTPSRNVHSDLTHVQTVLQRLRKSGLTEEKDFLKEQMLLSLLHSVTGDSDLAVRPQQEAKQEQYRRKQLRSEKRNNSHAMNDASGVPSDTLFTTTQGNSDSHGKDSSIDDEVDADPSQRLERIKQGQKVVKFATDVPAAKILSPSAILLRSKRRKSMQERRGLTGEDVLDDNTGMSGKNGRKKTKSNSDSLTEKELEDLKEQKELLLRLRKEREERRRKRRETLTKRPRAGNIRKRSRSSLQRKLPFNDDDDEEQEFDFTGEEGRNAKTLKSDETSNNERQHMPAEDHQQLSPTVMCPVCQESISVPSNDRLSNNSSYQEKLDSVLAQHLSFCQVRRSSRRTNRRIAPDLNSHQSTPSQQSNHALSETNEDGVVENISDDNEQDINFAPYEDDDDDTLVVEDVDDEIDDHGNTDKRKHTQKGFSRRKVSKQNQECAPAAIDDLNEDDYEDRVAHWIENGLNNMKNMKERDANESVPGEQVFEGGLVVPAWVNDRLFSYQRTGLQWMWELHRQQSGGILGDEMGLGKTIQVVSFLGAMAASRKLKSILIISPATMLEHWLQEMSKWAPGIRRVLVHQSGDSQSGPFISNGRRNVSTQKLAQMDRWLKEARGNRLNEIIDEEDLRTRDPSTFCGTAYAFVTTFENVRRNEHVWTGHNWSYVVMDEAQKIRNPNADITLVCKRLKTPHRLALSGTPIQNDLRELWSIFDFVFPGRLGTLPVFETEFADTIKRGGYTNATPMQVQLAYRCAIILRDLINPYLLRRMKKDIKEVQRMPGKKEQVLFCRLSDQQREMYEGFLRSDLMKQVFRGSAQLLGAITMLRKICNHPDLVCPPNKASLDSFIRSGYVNDNLILEDLDTDDDLGCDDTSLPDGDESRMNSFVQRSGKLEVLARILPLWKKQGHRVLIFCQWRKMLDLIMRFVQYQGWKYGRLDGNTNVASRQRLVNRFNEDDSYFIMLCTTRTGGVGLNLTGANRIILYDPDWNPQTDAQARERAWRFGQEREVTIYRLIVTGSVEEKIYQRQIFKTALSNRVLQDPRQRRLFSQKDLKDLFTLKEDNSSLRMGTGADTQTSQMTRGAGVVKLDEEESDIDKKDDQEIIRSVLQSDGIAGVFDHGVVESNNVTKKASVREMEEKAKTIAREALKTLSNSVDPGQDRFDPESRFSGSCSNSSGLLSSIAKRSDDIKDATSNNRSGDMQQYTKLLASLRDFVDANVPTTDEILETFSSQVSSLDAAVFRKLLKSVAELKQGRWQRKSAVA